MDPILRRGTSVLYGARPRAVSLAGRPLPANPHQRYPLVYAKVALVRCIAKKIGRSGRFRSFYPDTQTISEFRWTSGCGQQQNAAWYEIISNRHTRMKGRVSCGVTVAVICRVW